MSSKPETLCTGCGATVTRPGLAKSWRDVAGAKFCDPKAEYPTLHHVSLPPVAIKPEAAPQKFKHTPGEWKLDGNRCVLAKAFNGEWKYICDKVRGGNPQEADANAALIAMAPELLIALQSLCAEYRIGRQIRCEIPALHNAEALIARITKSKAEAVQA